MLKEYFHLRSKFGPFSVNFSESKTLLETLKITKKYVCLFIRPYPDRGIYSLKKNFDPNFNLLFGSLAAANNVESISNSVSCSKSMILKNLSSVLKYFLN